MVFNLEYMKNKLDIEILKEKKVFDKYFNNLLSNYLSKNLLDNAMLYANLNGGKRIRPYLLKEFAKIKNIKKERYLRLSATVELIHSYSLIHDDLPSMDNDDFRRGKPSLHKKFNEAQAILAGDSIHDLAFEILSHNSTHSNAGILLKLINFTAYNIGSKGLAGGQSLDLLYEKKKISLNNILKMYTMKTSSLFKICCVGPFIMKNSKKNEIKFASSYAEIFGIIFQIVDDYLDVFGKKKKIGKTLGKDIQQKKSTILNYYNNKETYYFCKKMIVKFEKENKSFLIKWPNLKKLLHYLLNQLS